MGSGPRPMLQRNPPLTVEPWAAGAGVGVGTGAGAGAGGGAAPDSRTAWTPAMFASAGIVVGFAARYAAVRAVRVVLGPVRSQSVLQPHDALAVFPLGLSAGLILGGLLMPESFWAKFLAPSDGHATIVFGSQWLGWLLVLHKRGELESGFASHAVGVTVVIIATLLQSSAALGAAVVTSVAVAARSGATRVAGLWAGVAVLAMVQFWLYEAPTAAEQAQRHHALAWAFCLVEVGTALSMKFKVPCQPLTKEKASRGALISDSDSSMAPLSFASPAPGMGSPPPTLDSRVASLGGVSSSTPKGTHRRMGSDSSTGWIVGAGVGMDASLTPSLDSIAELNEGADDDDDDEDEEADYG